jgi:hypothetical protein
MARFDTVDTAATNIQSSLESTLTQVSNLSQLKNEFDVYKDLITKLQTSISEAFINSITSLTNVRASVDSILTLPIVLFDTMVFLVFAPLLHYSFHMFLKDLWYV